MINQCFSGWLQSPNSLSLVMVISSFAVRVNTHEASQNDLSVQALKRSRTDEELLPLQLPIADRNYEPLYGRLNLQLFGHTVKLMQFDESTLSAVQSKGSPAAALAHALGDEVHSKHFHLVEDLIVLVATEVGFPTYFDVKTAEFTYGNRARLNFEHTEDGKFVLDFKRHFVHESRSHKMLGVALTFSRTSLGSGYDSRQLVSVPLELQITLDPAQRKLNIKRPVSLPVDLFSYHFLPYSFQLPYDRSSIDVPKLPGYPLYGDDDLYRFDRTYLNETLGVALNVQGHALKKDLKVNWQDFWHNMGLGEKLQYLIVNPRWSPRSFRLQFLPAEHDATNLVELDLSHHIYTPEDTERETSFDLSDSPTENSELPYTHALIGQLAYKGGARERKLSWELRYSFGKDLLRHNLLFYYDRLPFSPSEQNHTKVCVIASTKFPKIDHTKLGQLAAFHRGHEIQAHMKLHYGSECNDDSVISFSGKYTHTDEDFKEIDAIASGAAGSSKRPSRLRELYAKCAQEKERGLFLGHHCVDYLYLTSRLGKLILDVQYKTPQTFLPAVTRHYLDFTRSHPGSGGFLSTVASHMKGQSGELHVEAQVPAFSGRSPHAEVMVTGPDGRTHRYDHVPTYTHLLEPRVFIAFRYSNMAEYSHYYKHRYCDVQGQSARTFDGVIVQLPRTDCYKVVARDCSVNKRFVVLARALPNDAFPKALKVFIHNTEVEILPAGDGDHTVVKVDGAPITLGDGGVYAHTQDGAELFTVSTPYGMYNIASKSYGLDVFFNGRILFVQVAPFYRGKMCGLCGDYNYERHRELVGSKLHLYEDTLSFAKSYVVPSSDCTAP